MNVQAPETVDAGLLLLDRQIVDCNDREVANVDDLEIAFDSDGRPYVVTILCGPGAWGPRLGGRVSRWIVAIWQRLHPAVHPEPARVPMNVVAKIDSAVHLSVPRKSTSAIVIDRWVDDHIISRIPGAGDDDP
jgi:hypothetical protein